MTDYLIIANGPFLVKEIIRAAMHHKTAISLDGATDRLLKMGLLPEIILGDFDSITKSVDHFGITALFPDLTNESKPYQGLRNTVIVPAKNQLYTDLQKAIHYCDQHEAQSITIICATGGRLDHHETSLRTLRTEYKKSRPILLHTESHTLRFAKDEAVEISGEMGDKCGIMAFPKGMMSSTGLEFEADNFPLEFGFSENTCNSLVKNIATVDIKGEALIMMPPQLLEQRAFMQLSEAERLQLLLRDLQS